MTRLVAATSRLEPDFHYRVGFRLFDRTTRHVELTVIQRSPEEMDSAIANIGRSAKRTHQTISLGTTPLVAANILAPAMHEF